MNSSQLDLWPAEAAALPWGGQSPRSLAQVLVADRIGRFIDAACGVDNFSVRCPSREALWNARGYTDAAQLQVCICTHPSVE